MPARSLPVGPQRSVPSSVTLFRGSRREWRGCEATCPSVGMSVSKTVSAGEQDGVAVCECERKLQRGLGTCGVSALTSQA